MTMHPANAMQITAFGNGALTANTTGVYNAAFGSAALIANTTGSRQHRLRRRCAHCQHDGHLRTPPSGNAALEFNTTGSGNAAFGVSALFATRRQYNSAFGTSHSIYLTGGQ